MSTSVVHANPVGIELQPEPIPPEWILSGEPVARSSKLVTSRDWVSTVVVWDCTAGTFHWHYGQDEVILVISGDAVLLNDKGGERRFGPGDLGFFPAGSVATWRVDNYIRKVAVLRETMWRPVGFLFKVYKKLLRIAGIAGKSPLMLALASSPILWFLQR